jgi:3-deoxy-D-manno-octulosonic-acid transferase
VGEVITLAPLLRELRSELPRLPILLTTNTPTGADTAAKLFPVDVTHRYLPLDWRYCVARFLQRTRPRAAIVMETELWPHLYAQCADRDIPIVLINARLSPKTTNTKGRWRRLLQDTLQYPSAILARSDADTDAYRELGAPDQAVRTTGNLKYAGSVDISTKSPVAPGYVLAASTHEGEELKFAQLWQRNPAWPPLVIAPRHPQRRDSILRALKGIGVTPPLRSVGDELRTETRVYLADTLGELDALISGAQLVIMGGSFVPVGGHNLLEPARHAKPILFGPHMHNFADISARLLAAEGAVQSQNESELEQLIQVLLNNPSSAAVMGQAAKQVAAHEADIARRYLDELVLLLALTDASA